MASVPVDPATHQLGNTAQFERMALALGWTPPGSTCGRCPTLSSSMCDPAQTQDDMPMETDCLAADSDLANLQPGTLTLSTNNTPSIAADHQAEGSDEEDTQSSLTPSTCR